MPTQKLAQNNFTSGQYDRAAQGKEGSPLVANGLAKSMNVVSSERGELRKRLGTKHIMDLDSERVIVPFRMPDGNDILFLFGQHSIEAYKFTDNGNIIQYIDYIGSAPEFPSAWTSNTNGNWTIDTSSSLGNDYQAFTSTGGSFGCKVTSTGQNDWDGIKKHYVMIYNKTPMVFSSCHVKWDSEFFQAYTEYVIFMAGIDPVIQYSDDGNSWTSIRTNISNTKTTGELGGRSKLGARSCTSTYEYDVGNVEHIEPHNYWRILFTNQTKKTNCILNQQTQTYGNSTLFVSDVKFLPLESKPLVITDVPFDNLKDIKYSQYDVEMVLTQKHKRPYKISFKNANLTYGAYTPNQPSPTSLWESLGYPSGVTYFQNRLWFGGFELYPYKVVSSKFGEFDEFTRSSPIAYDDYLDLACNQLKTQITNIFGAQNVLYAFSEDGISFVDGGSIGLLATNQSIEFNLKNRMPAGSVTPTVKDDVLLYASSDGTKLYGVDYDLLIDRFQVSDLAEYAKDTVSAKIGEIHYLNNKAKLVYGLLNDGNMFSLLYKKGNYQGFYPISIQDGKVHDICVAKVGQDYKLFMVTQRRGQWAIEEKLDVGKFVDTNDPLMSAEEKKWATYDNLENNIALDSYRKYDESVQITGTYTDNSVAFEKEAPEFVGKSIMLGQINDDKNWAIFDILKQKIGYAYYTYPLNAPIEQSLIYSTSDSRDEIGAPLYRFQNGIFQYVGEIAPRGEEYLSNPYSGDNLVRYKDGDRPVPIYDANKRSQRGINNYFDIVYPAFTKFTPGVNAGDIGIISEGRYIENAKHVSVDRESYAWTIDNEIIYTDSQTPKKGDVIYDETGEPATKYYNNSVFAVFGNTITIESSSQTISSQDFFAWGTDTVYTLKVNPTIGDQLYNSDGTLINKYPTNKVYGVSDTAITVITEINDIKTQYAWTDIEGKTVYIDKQSPLHGQIFPYWPFDLFGCEETPVSITNKATRVVYYRKPEKDNKNLKFPGEGYHGWALCFESNAGDDLYARAYDAYYSDTDHIRDIFSLGDNDQLISEDNRMFTVQYERNGAFVYDHEGNRYDRDSGKDIPAHQDIKTIDLPRDNSKDIKGQTTTIITTKDFKRNSALDLSAGTDYIELPYPVHKITYGFTYDAYAYIKIQKPYESMKSIQQIDLAVIDTMHLEVGTCLDDMQELEKINDSSHYDLTNITLNGIFRIVPSDTPEWEKNIILRSSKGLPFTVNAVEVFVNYSNMGGN